MGDAGVEALARALPQMASLMTLKLSSIARLLCDSRRLIMSLARLGYCTSSLDCAPLTATYTPTHHSVSVAGLRYAVAGAARRSSDLVIVELCAALAKIPSLRTVYISGYGYVVKLVGALPKMAGLMALHLHGTSSLSLELPCVGVTMPRPIRG
jgi:hypothetical protein